jgi:monoamine oxidase
MYEATGRRPLEQLSILRMFQEVTRARVEMKEIPEAQRRILDHYEISSIISSHIIGGTSRLPEAMAAHLGDRLRLASPVASISQSATDCEVTLSDGQRIRSDFVIAALPFSSLRKLRLTPALSGPQAEAVQSMP